MQFNSFSWKHLRIATRLAVGFGVLLLLGSLQGLLALRYLSRIEARVENLYTQELIVLEALDDAKSAAYRIRGDVLEHILAETPASQNRLEREIEAQRSRIRERIRQYRDTRLSGEERRLLAAFESHFQTYLGRVITDILPLSAAGRKAEAEALARGVAVQEFRDAREAMNDLMDYNLARGRTRYRNAVSAYEDARWIVLFIIGLTALLGALVAFHLTRAVAHPLQRLTTYFDQISRGNLAVQIDTSRTDEFGRVFTALNDTQTKLASLREQEREHERRAIASHRLAAVGELAAGVAHEVNNPLHAISGFAEMLLAEGGLPQEVRDDLEIIRAEARRAGTIVRNMLAFARQEVPEKRALDLADVIHQVLKLRGTQLDLANVGVELDLDPEAPRVYADSYQLQQVLHNLVTNAGQAVQHAFGSGAVRIRLRPAGDMVELVVEDTGPGLSPEVMEKMFSPFFTTKGVGEGTGLGLSVTHGIVQEHGGEIRAENWGLPPVLGGNRGAGGARITIRLPRAEEEVETELVVPPPHDKVGADRTRRVLLVEDEQPIATVVRKFLQRKGYEVEVCSRAEDAVERLRGEKAFDAILSDCKMPGMGGEGLYRWIEQNRPELRRTLIFSSGDRAAPGTHHFLEETGCPVLPKPYELSELGVKLAEIIEGAEPSL